ncbi:helix-turn-helix transcriptional regulator, partial [Shewanella litoralis]|uniref:helix-turn-helix transcriptional regulator n=1 Tax=Shewanella litoralis TaxID=2282700 RepID=UPI0013579863
RDLAGQLGISVRTLQDGFTRHVGLPPITYLREIRLAQAHADLAAGDAGTSVSATACKWGFTHLGRFAAAYRDRYGEHPSETLRASGTDTLQV